MVAPIVGGYSRIDGSEVSITGDNRQIAVSADPSDGSQIILVSRPGVELADPSDVPMSPLFDPTGFYYADVAGGAQAPAMPDNMPKFCQPYAAEMLRGTAVFRSVSHKDDPDPNLAGLKRLKEVEELQVCAVSSRPLNQQWSAYIQLPQHKDMFKSNGLVMSTPVVVKEADLKVDDQKWAEIRVPKQPFNTQLINVISYASHTYAMLLNVTIKRDSKNGKPHAKVQFENTALGGAALVSVQKTYSKFNTVKASKTIMEMTAGDTNPDTGITWISMTTFLYPNDIEDMSSGEVRSLISKLSKEGLGVILNGLLDAAGSTIRVLNLKPVG